jgi:uncharacterized protein YerC
MLDHDFSKLSRKELMEHFEQERQEWLAAGMNEADIIKIHYGDKNDNGNSLGAYAGDYAMWLSERKHERSEPKYAPGAPVAIYEIDPDNEWIACGRNEIGDAEFNIDLEAALSTLTQLQRFCFTEIYVHGRGYVDIADESGKSLGTISRAVRRAKENLIIFFDDRRKNTTSHG